MVTDTAAVTPRSADRYGLHVSGCAVVAESQCRDREPQALVAAINTNVEQPIESIVRKRDSERRSRRQLDKTHEVMGSSNMMTIAREQGNDDWDDGVTEIVVNQVHSPTFDSSTCAAGEQETPRFEVKSLFF